jgi:hypothetical protein
MNHELFAALEGYNQATYKLAKELYEIKKQHGRKVIEDITNLDINRINILCRLGAVSMEISNNISPELVIELLGEDTVSQRKFLKKAIKDNLKPSQLRKLVRKKNKTLITKDKKVKINNWQKHLIMLENEMKNMDISTKQRALAHVANTILL